MDSLPHSLNIQALSLKRQPSVAGNQFTEFGIYRARSKIKSRQARFTDTGPSLCSVTACYDQKNEQYAHLTMTGDFDPQQITVRLGLEPTESWRKGDRNERTHYERKFSRWSLESRLSRSAALDEHIRDVVEQANPFAEALREVGKEFECWIQLVGYFHTDYPGFHLDRETISALARLNLSVDCDFYYLYSHEREDSE